MAVQKLSPISPIRGSRVQFQSNATVPPVRPVAVAQPLLCRIAAVCRLACIRFLVFAKTGPPSRLTGHAVVNTARILLDLRLQPSGRQEEVREVNATTRDSSLDPLWPRGAQGVGGSANKWVPPN